MALVECVECGREISDRATACPGCGYPAPALAGVVAAPGAARPRWHRLVRVIVPGAILLGLLVWFARHPYDMRSEPDPERLAARKKVCIDALLSSVGHSTVGYADKAAYDKVVREKCEGLSINGAPIGQ